MTSELRNNVNTLRAAVAAQGPGTSLSSKHALLLRRLAKQAGPKVSPKLLLAALTAAEQAKKPAAKRPANPLSAADPTSKTNKFLWHHEQLMQLCQFLILAGDHDDPVSFLPLIEALNREINSRIKDAGFSRHADGATPPAEASRSVLRGFKKHWALPALDMAGAAKESLAQSAHSAKKQLNYWREGGRAKTRSQQTEWYLRENPSAAKRPVDYDKHVRPWLKAVAQAHNGTYGKTGDVSWTDLKKYMRMRRDAAIREVMAKPKATPPVAATAPGRPAVPAQAPRAKAPFSRRRRAPAKVAPVKTPAVASTAPVDSPAVASAAPVDSPAVASTPPPSPQPVQAASVALRRLFTEIHDSEPADDAELNEWLKLNAEQSGAVYDDATRRVMTGEAEAIVAAIDWASRDK